MPMQICYGVFLIVVCKHPEKRKLVAAPIIASVNGEVSRELVSSRLVQKLKLISSQTASLQGLDDSCAAMVGPLHY
jgi:hypothetical protein